VLSFSARRPSRLAAFGWPPLAAPDPRGLPRKAAATGRGGGRLRPLPGSRPARTPVSPTSAPWVTCTSAVTG